MGWIIEEQADGTRKPVFVEDTVAPITVEQKPVQMEEYHKVDLQTGERLDVLLLDSNGDIPEDCKRGWGEGFHNPIWDFKQDTWVEGRDYNEILDEAKRDKDIELNMACEQSILAGFNHTIDGVEYHFSYDSQAQQNFGDSRALLTEGVITQIPWTVKLNGEYARIIVTKEIMDGLTVTVLLHKTNNISKYRDILLPKVMNATTVEEVGAVVWE